MKIAIATWTGRLFGGAETYLDMVLSTLGRAGHQLALLCEVTIPTERAALRVPEGTPTWCAAELSAPSCLARLKAWQPDVIFSHGLRDVALEAELLTIAPTVLYAHNYSGACISGSKTFAFPRVRPCGQAFDRGCLVRFYPRRCGGLNPVTTWRLYRRETRRGRLLRRYDALVVATEHMRRELLRQGVAPARVRVSLQPVINQAATRSPWKPSAALAGPAPARLLFVGRMVELKGGSLLLSALPAVAAGLQRPARLVMAGDGPARPVWEASARRLTRRYPGITIDFPGWLEVDAVAAAAVDTDLLVMPSVWPEPFGRVGLEVGCAGVPSVAFRVGGIPDWLSDGVNGHLAVGDPPTAASLAEAIVRSLADPAHHADLRRGAHATAARFSTAQHVNHLLEVFAQVQGQRAERGAVSRLRRWSRRRAAGDAGVSPADSATRPAAALAPKAPASSLRVLFVVEGFTDIRFVAGLAAICDLTMLVPAREYCSSGLDRRVAELGVPARVVPIRGGRPAFQLRSLRWLWHNVRQFDVIVAQEVLRGALNANLAGAIRRVPVVTYTATAPREYFRCRRERGQIGWLSALAGETAIRILLAVNGRLATRCLALGSYLRTVAERDCSRTGLGLYYGVDTTRFRPAAADERDALRERLDLPRESFLVLLSSRMSHEKDPETVLRAVAMLRQRGLNAVLLNLSGGWREFLDLAAGLGLPDVDAWVIGRPAVHPMTEVFDYFRVADAVAQASLAEGLGFATLEGLACGTPVVATAVGGMAVQLAGYARLVPRRDAVAMADELEWVARNPQAAREQALQGRNYVIREWEQTKAFDDLGRVLLEVARAGRGRSVSDTAS